MCLVNTGDVVVLEQVCREEELVDVVVFIGLINNQNASVLR